MGAEQHWLVWSNEHLAWWKPSGFGYTTRIEFAGRYSRAEADFIVAQAERVTHDPPNEVAVMAPHPDDIKRELAPDDAGMLSSLRLDKCPDCGSFPLIPGPRGGLSQNVSCANCGGRWNIGPARFVVFAEKIG